MKKLVNVRLAVVCACFLVLGIVGAATLYFFKMNFFLLFTAIPVFIAVYFILRRYKGKALRFFIFALLPLLLFMAGGLNTFFTLQRYDRALDSGSFCKISGRVVEKGITTSGNEYVIIDNFSADGNKSDGRVYAYLYDGYGEYCDVGYTVEFSAEINRYYSFVDGSVSYNAIEGVKYYADVYGGMKSKRGFSLFGGVRSAITDFLYDNLNNESAAVCIALLLGNTQHLDTDTVLSFRNGGIAHLFAVSGLHIGIVFGMTGFILKKLRADKYLSAFICIAIIFLYAGVCGFSLSSVRAVIMCAVAVIARLLYCKYDSLNSLGIAVILILFISPLSLFSVGFQLSICSLGAIDCFTSYIKKLLKKIKTPDFIASSAGVAIGAQLGSLPVLLANFGYVSAVGLLLNIILVPLISVLFVIIFFALSVALIIPVAAPFLVPATVTPLEAILSFIVSAGFERALITGVGSGLFVPVYFTVLPFLSDKLNLKPRYKLTALAIGIILLTIICLI